MLQKTSGSTLIIVLLISLIIMGTLMATVSSTVVTARTGSATERLAYNSLLGAEAGINSFAARIQLSKYTGQISDIDCWVQGSRAPGNSSAGTCPYTAKLSSYTLGTNSVAVSVVDYNASASSITVRSVGTSTATASNSKTVLQDFQVTKPPTTNLAIPAALTSYPSIQLTGGGALLGAPYASSGSGSQTTYSTTLNAANNGVLTNFSTLTAAFNSGSSNVLTVNSADASYFAANSYIRVGGKYFKVTSKSGSTLTVSQLTAQGSGNANVASGGAVDLIQFAARGAATNVTSTTARIPISDPTGFYVNDVVYMTIGGVVYRAQVTGSGYTSSADLNSGYLDVKYTATSVGNTLGTALTQTAAANLLEGTGISRYVPGASSAFGISAANNTSLFPSSAANNSNILSGENLFRQTFSGKSKQDVYNLSKIYSTVPTSLVPTEITWVGPTGNYATTSSSISLNNGYLCGDGILIITGSLTLNGTCNAGFTGLLYIMGDLSNQGQATIKGAVVVEGQVNTGGTKAAGGMNITYDSSIFLKRGQLLATVSVIPITATWRQK
ncbi:hypothetical protein [Deinococcus roseus]|uniref:Type 4 fimbrial biogenesis protein PilX N-terminal domain-containing protein n=1 Tax=Deinococcus roseus TaxID=392414 RepID=A0ABQ2CZD4_9DEIO|nr:hypothetical protein [Deinococcus roseus]GGJ35746.1 hypothetical protein GCM10008938_22330 [Deinococcus roseus]